jgi:serine/threonine protein kinase
MEVCNAFLPVPLRGSLSQPRPPALLNMTGARKYSTAVDMWSAGCIMAELLQKEPLFNGVNEIAQVDTILKIMGMPTEENWPGACWHTPCLVMMGGSRYCLHFLYRKREQPLNVINGYLATMAGSMPRPSIEGSPLFPAGCRFEPATRGQEFQFQQSRLQERAERALWSERLQGLWWQTSAE